MKKIFIFILLTITSCGYQPLYKINNEPNNLKIQSVKFTGDRVSNRQIFTNLPFILIKNDQSLNKVIIDSKKNTIEASKNSLGQVTSYRTTLIVNLKILNNNEDIIDEKVFQKEFHYTTNESTFKLKEYEDKIEVNLIEGIVEDIIIYLNYS